MTTSKADNSRVRRCHCAFRRYGRLVPAGALLLSAVTSPAAFAKSENFDAFVRHEAQTRHIVGLAVAVIDHGKLRKRVVYGKASLEFDRPVTTRTPFSVASISKSFTAVAVMRLVERGKVNLDSAIGSYLSDLPESWRSVTVRQLLDHTSGIPDISVDSYGTSTIVETPEEMLRLLRHRPLDFAPGSAYQYTTTNYVLLKMLIERVSGQSYEAFCASQLFGSPKLTTASFGDARTVVHGLASAYTPYRFGGPRPIVMDHVEVLSNQMPPMAYAGGGLNISLDDFSSWLIALLDGKLIRKASLDQLWTPTRFADGTTYKRPPSGSQWREYGLGWVLETDGPHPFAGGTGGIRAAFFVFPKDALAVIVLTNTQGSRPESLVVAIAQRFFRDRAAGDK